MKSTATDGFFLWCRQLGGGGGKRERAVSQPKAVGSLSYYPSCSYYDVNELKPFQVYGFSSYDLISDGGSVDVTSSNCREYVDKCTDFYLNTGIRRQMKAFKNGFNLVCPLEKLRAFSPDEIQVGNTWFRF